jgi:hypothetical protein
VRLSPGDPAHTPQIVQALTKRCVVDLALGAEHGVAIDRCHHHAYHSLNTVRCVWC